jgi:hypothetical protein
MLQFFARRLKELHEVERDERGFTLIELLIVAKNSVKERSTISLRLALCHRSVYTWPKSSLGSKWPCWRAEGLA